MRMLCALICAFITIGFSVLWADRNGYLNIRTIVGVCGFKQRFSLPCPGCGWTHAAQAFITGHFIEAFITQPAAALFSLIAVLMAFFSLLFALFGIDFGLPKRIFSPAGTKLLLIAAISVILAGWMVTLARTIVENAKL